jgi:hypothetical protein
MVSDVGSYGRTGLSICRVSSMDLQMSVDESKIAVHHFFNNKFNEARELLQPW